MRAFWGRSALFPASGRPGEMAELWQPPRWLGAVPLSEHELPSLSHSPIQKALSGSN